MSFVSKHILRGAAASCALATAFTFINPAIAQDAPVAAEEPAAPGEILVTARRSSERLSDIPMSVDAFSNETLKEKNISGLEEIANYTPGLKFADFATGFNGNIAIRGLQQASVQNAVGNVGVFVDNIYLQRTYMINSGLGDYERIEVVKGPQSALYGENTFSGAINYVTRLPGDELEMNGTVSIGNGGYAQIEGAIGGPIIKDLLAARVYYGRSTYNGVWKNNMPGIAGHLEELGGYDRENFSASLVLTPTSRLKITAQYNESTRNEEIKPYYTLDGNLLDDKMNCGTIVAATGRGALWCGDLPSNPDDRRSGAGSAPGGLLSIDQPNLMGGSRMWRGNVQWEATDDLTLAYTYGNVEGHALAQFSFQSNPINPIGRTTISVQKEGGRLEYDSHEFRAIFANSDFPLSGELGYFHSEATDRFIFGTGVVPVNTPIPLFSRDPLNTTGVSASRNGIARYNTDAIFGRLNMKVGAATVSAELRRSEVQISQDDRIARTANPDLPLLEATFRSWLPRFTASYELNDGTMLYGSMAKGEKAGGFNGYVTGTVQLLESEQSFGPESNWTYEVGLKGSFFDRKLSTNLSLFYVDWANKQTTVIPFNYPVDLTSAGVVPARIYGVAGSARSLGVELSGQVRPTSGLSFNYALSWQDPKYRKAFAQDYAAACDNVVCPRSGDLTGNTIEGVSKVQGTIGVDYRFDLSDTVEMFFMADESYRGRQYVNPVNVTTIAPVWLTNFQVGANIDRNIKVFAWAKNLFDEKYVSASLAIPTIRQYNVNMGERRTFGLTASFNY